MTPGSKLKPDRSLIGLIPGIAAAALFFTVLTLFGIGPAYTAISLFVFIICFMTFRFYLLTQNPVYLVGALFIFFEFLWFASWPGSLFGLSDRKAAGFFTLCTLIALVFLLHLWIVKRNKWRGRDLLELAARPVDDVTNGFTERPHPSGKIEASRVEIRAFASFCLRNLIAWPYAERDRIVLVPLSADRALLYQLGWIPPAYRDRTWVGFDFEGNVSVNISRKDYDAYRDQFAFDQLCENLGTVMVEFFEWFRAEEEARILDRLDAMKVSVFS